jgi:hypothetical protein
MPVDRHASLAGKLLQKPAAVSPINLYLTPINAINLYLTPINAKTS